MKKSLLAIGFVLSVVSGAVASEQVVNQEAMPTEAVVVEVGNKICPVSNHDVGEMGGPLKITHQGKVDNLCCSMCKKDFLANPQKFTKIAEDEVANQVK